MATTVVNIKTGARGDVYIGRGAGGRVATTPGERGYFGNPVAMHSEADRSKVIEEYRRYFTRRIESDPTFRAEVLKLRDRQLVCWCHPLPCHGHVMAAWLDKQGACSC